MEEVKEMMKLDEQKIKEYNNERKKYIELSSRTQYEIDANTKEIERLCAELSSEIGEQVTPENIQEIYNARVQQIQQELENGTEILNRIKAAEVQGNSIDSTQQASQPIQNQNQFQGNQFAQNNQYAQSSQYARGNQGQVGNQFTQNGQYGNTGNNGNMQSGQYGQFNSNQNMNNQFQQNQQYIQQSQVNTQPQFDTIGGIGGVGSQFGSVNIQNQNNQQAMNHGASAFGNVNQNPLGAMTSGADVIPPMFAPKNPSGVTGI